MLIYDIEIQRAIPNRDGRREPGIEYCDGWGDFARMGIAVIGAYDYKADCYRVFCHDNLADFAELLGDMTHQGRTVVGYNNRSFDDRLLAANGMIVGRSYDLLVEIWRAAGLGPQFNHRTHGGYGLGAMAEKNLGIGKTGSGDLAPIAWQRGRIGEVIDYCLNDVWLTKGLLDRAIAGEKLLSPVDGRELAVKGPDERPA